MIVPSVYSLQKLSDDEFFDFMKSIYLRREKAAIMNKIHIYCKSMRIPYSTTSNSFFNSQEENNQAECICKGIVRLRNAKCTRKARNGTEYCGFHQNQGASHRLVRRVMQPQEPQEPQGPPPPRAGGVGLWLGRN
tara:strand:+ start:268 stop:672 length:405 start_codon:yes stop_codon:yes gene_type:complete